MLPSAFFSFHFKAVNRQTNSYCIAFIVAMVARHAANPYPKARHHGKSLHWRKVRQTRSTAFRLWYTNGTYRPTNRDEICKEMITVGYLLCLERQMT